MRDRSQNEIGGQRLNILISSNFIEKWSELMYNYNNESASIGDNCILSL